MNAFRFFTPLEKIHVEVDGRGGSVNTRGRDVDRPDRAICRPREPLEVGSIATPDPASRRVRLHRSNAKTVTGCSGVFSTSGEPTGPNCRDLARDVHRARPLSRPRASRTESTLSVADLPPLLPSENTGGADANGEATETGASEPTAIPPIPKRRRTADSKSAPRSSARAKKGDPGADEDDVNSLFWLVEVRLDPAGGRGCPTRVVSGA